MKEQQLPLIARLTVHALGVVDAERIRRPIDPVCAWMARHLEGLVPDGVAPAAYATIRARTALVDGLIAEEIHRAERAGDELCLWSIGGALDARWMRLAALLSEAVREYREVEDPDLLGFKEALLRSSPYARAWKEVAQRPSTSQGWTSRPVSGTRPLVVLEGLAGRLTPAALRRLLQRVLYETPDATAIVGLPGVGREDALTWTHATLRGLGWKITQDVNLAPRGRLLNPEGEPVCAGMYPLRVLRLVALRTP